MAIAGKVAITLSEENDGKWSASVTYDKLVAVTHNNNLYISKKTSTNEEPTVTNEFWFLALEGFSGEELGDIINGTTQVGNAKTLDGHGVDEFIQTAKGGTVTAPLNIDSAVFGANVRNPNLEKGTLPSSTAYISVNLMEKGGTTHKNRIGQLQTSVDTSGNVQTAINAFKFEKDGTTAQSLGVVCTPDGTGYGFAPTPSNASDNSNKISTTKWINNRKPTGTYTGNGDSTARTINVGGIGGALLIFGNSYYAYVTPVGAIYAKYNTADSVKSVTQAECNFANGVLTIATNLTAFNGDSSTYNYQVL